MIDKLERERTEYQVYVAWMRPQGIRSKLSQTIDCTDEGEQKRIIREWVARQEDPDGPEVVTIVARERQVFTTPWAERTV